MLGSMPFMITDTRCSFQLLITLAPLVYTQYPLVAAAATAAVTVVVIVSVVVAVVTIH